MRPWNINRGLLLSYNDPPSGEAVGGEPMFVRVLEEFCNRYVSKESGASRGFDPTQNYRVHKIESYSESGNGFVVLVNELDEIWWVDNRHVRVTSEGEMAYDLPLRAADTHRYVS